MAKTQKSPLGLKGKAEVVEIYAAVTNSDREEGRGQSVDHSYYLTSQGAELGGIEEGVFGSDAEVEKRLVVHLEDGTYLLLNQETPLITLGDESKLRQDVRKKALAKLRPAERKALGIEVKGRGKGGTGC